MAATQGEVDLEAVAAALTKEQIDSLVNQMIEGSTAAGIKTVDEAMPRMTATGGYFVLPIIQASYLLQTEQFPREEVSRYLGENGRDEENGGEALLNAYFKLHSFAGMEIPQSLREMFCYLKIELPQSTIPCDVLFYKLAEEYCACEENEQYLKHAQRRATHVLTKEQLAQAISMEKEMKNKGSETPKGAAELFEDVTLDEDDLVRIYQMLMMLERALRDKTASGRSRKTFDDFYKHWHDKDSAEIPGFDRQTLRGIYQSMVEWSIYEKEKPAQPDTASIAASKIGPGAAGASDETEVKPVSAASATDSAAAESDTAPAPNTEGGGCCVIL